MITAPAEEVYAAMADPTARNEVCAHHALEVAFNRPTTLASRLTCPLLMQVGTDDDVVPHHCGAPRREERRTLGTAA